jgi:hypothetical protein
MAKDLVETLTGVGETIKSGLQGMKNASAPPGPGKAAAPLIDTPSGKARINPDGSPPTVVVDDSITKKNF